MTEMVRQVELKKISRRKVRNEEINEIIFI